jgi:aryl-alcohol dehydrogenase-like predicted oxidoreductase
MPMGIVIALTNLVHTRRWRGLVDSKIRSHAGYFHEAEILPLCEELGTGFVAYRPLGRGILTGKVTDIAALRAGDARRNMPRFQGDNLRRNLALVEELKKHAAAENCTPAQLAIAWVLSRAANIVPIPGTSHRHRLEENAAALSVTISADTAAALLKLFAPDAASGPRYPENHLKRLGI